MAVRDETVRFRLTTEGEKELASLAKEIDQLGDISKEAEAKASALLNEFAQAKKTEAAIQQFNKLRKEMIETNRSITENQARLKALSQEIKSVENPSRELVREYERLQVTTKKLSAEQDKQKTTLTGLKGQLNAAGVDMKQLSRAQTQAAESAQFATAKLREFTASQRQAADSAQRVAQAQQQAAAQTKNLGTASTQAESGISRLTASLKGVVAGAAAYLSLQKLKESLFAILKTGDQFEKFQQQLTVAFGSAEKGREAFAFIKDFAKNTPLELNQVTESFLKLKNFGIDPTNGTLQALVDQNSALGGSYETLNGLILATGQAWAKCKLQGEEILQLVERGVPVYDLLSKATGRTAAEIQNLSSQGKLGRDVIKQLIDEIAKQNLGAASQQMKTLSGLVSNLKDQATEFLNRIANAGVLDYFKAQLTALGDQIARLTKTGELDAYAKRISDGIIATANAVKSGIQSIYEYSGVLLQLAKAYAAFKIGSLLVDLSRVSKGFLDSANATRVFSQTATEATGTVGKLRAGLKALPANAQIAIALIGVELAIQGAKKLGEAIGDALASDEVRKSQEELQQTASTLANRYSELAQKYQQFAREQVLSAEQVAKLSEQERAAYATRLKGLEDYQKAELRSLEIRQKAGIATDNEISRLEELRTQLSATRTGFESLATGAKTAGDALKDGITQGAVQFKQQLQGIQKDSETASKKISEIFKTLDFGSATTLSDFALGLASIGAESEKTAAIVRDGLGEALKNLSGEQLLWFQANAQSAFEQLGTSAQEASLVLETTLQAALERLGLSGAQLGIQFTKAGKDILATFQTVVESAQATGQQIEAAFKAALAKAATPEEIERLGQLLEQAGKRGQLSFEQTERSLAALQNRLDQVNGELDPLADAFAQLGIKSQRSLDDAANASKRSLDLIVAAFRSGQRPIEDMQRAFVAYAKAALAASKDGAQWAKDQVELQLEVQASVLGVSDALKEVGLAGKESGDQVASSYDKAKESLDAAAIAAGNLSLASKQSAEDTQAAAAATQQAAQAAQQAADAIAKGVIALGTEQNRAQQILTEELNRVGNLSQISLDNARYVLQNLGGLLGEQSNELASHIQQLEGVANQAAQAGQQLQQLRDQLRDENDRANGNEVDIENRRYKEQLRQIQELANQAGGNNAQIAAEAKKQADELHARKLKQLEDEKNARLKAEDDVDNRKRGSTSSSTKPGSRGESSSSGGITYNVTNINHISQFGELDKKQAETLSEQIARPIKKQLDAIAFRSR